MPLQAFTVLSRAIESHPTSAVLWVIYLHIFYMKEEGIGKDDMFLHAVCIEKTFYYIES